ncbi:uracil-DNA glycosylase family protein [Pararhodobacter sp. CCB-MM2]|uniref:uracil-DNA glycosylase n=1 Tax=Pararhodobacter sp. CCB-MM2 TaxID=1786003 RepID=UPI00082C7396|nr:uracil-DNA glycosylase [Pararhodobacter sp. CCB-MM2]
MNAQMDWHLARALLEWQVELGVDEALMDAPVDRFARAAEIQAEREAERAAPVADVVPKRGGAPAPVAAPVEDEVEVAIRAAQQSAAYAADLPSLAEALAAFPHCDLKRGARSCVFADGNPQARVMIVGEGPGAEEDRQGKPFVGRAGQLLDAMFAAIGLSRTAPDPAQALYITNTVPWRPPGNREPSKPELAMLKPFLMRHIELAQPDLIVIMGNVACDALLEQRGILRLRGKWAEVAGRPALPMLHPAYLLRNNEAKREAWADLLALKARLRQLP